jgi:hypothetical protein
MYTPPGTPPAPSTVSSATSDEPFEQMAFGHMDNLQMTDDARESIYNLNKELQ